MTGKLYIVATPIGNMGDMTFRAVEVLRSVGLVAAEDTRRTVKLLNYFGIKCGMVSFHEHSKGSRLDDITGRLLAGDDVALVSDAGTPVISDPGLLLVRACIEKGIPVESLPGANAAVTAVTLSGIDCRYFIFAGFLPQKGAARKKRLVELAGHSIPLVLYESPARITGLLREISEVMGPSTPVCVARELTKLHEEVLRGGAGEVLEAICGRETVKGEFVVVTGVAEERESVTDDAIKERLEQLLCEGHTKKEAVTMVTADLLCPKNKVYAIMLQIK